MKIEIDDDMADAIIVESLRSIIDSLKSDIKRLKSIKKRAAFQEADLVDHLVMLPQLEAVLVYYGGNIK